eukprot:m.228416 g.228416  ORF g.228416 m.228416 type:complete len:287 (+) comp40043_c0_seq54:5296-6156(+)
MSCLSAKIGMVTTVVCLTAVALCVTEGGSCCTLDISYFVGLGRSKKELSKEQEKECVREIPSPLVFFSFVFNFSTALVGPPCYYREYIEYIEGKHCIARHKDGSIRPTSGTLPSLRKFLSAFLWAGMYVKFSAVYRIELNKDIDFLKRTPLIERVWMGYMSMVAQRFRYYFAWSIADGVANGAGLGFNGLDENSNEKWDLITNANALNAEFPISFKLLLDHWNIQTTKWLRRVCYDRIKVQPVLLTNLLSAWWHGFYPVYYAGWLGFALAMIAARHVTNWNSFYIG